MGEVWQFEEGLILNAYVSFQLTTVTVVTSREAWCGLVKLAIHNESVFADTKDVSGMSLSVRYDDLEEDGS